MTIVNSLDQIAKPCASRRHTISCLDTSKMPFLSLKNSKSRLDINNQATKLTIHNERGVLTPSLDLATSKPQNSNKNKENIRRLSLPENISRIQYSETIFADSFASSDEIERSNESLATQDGISSHLDGKLILNEKIFPASRVTSKQKNKDVNFRASAPNLSDLRINSEKKRMSLPCSFSLSATKEMTRSASLTFVSKSRQYSDESLPLSTGKETNVGSQENKFSDFKAIDGLDYPEHHDAITEKKTIGSSNYLVVPDSVPGMNVSPEPLASSLTRLVSEGNNTKPLQRSKSTPAIYQRSINSNQDLVSQETLLTDEHHEFNTAKRYQLQTRSLTNINESQKQNRLTKAPMSIQMTESPRIELAENIETINEKVYLEFKRKSDNELNSEHYVFCSSINGLPINYMGMTLDNEGQLVLIRGKNYNLFKGMITKLTSGYKYEASVLKSAEGRMKFEALYIDENRSLIGVERGTRKHYSITVTIPTQSLKEPRQLIELNFTENLIANEQSRFNFQVNEKFTATFLVEKDKLYLTSIYEKENNELFENLKFEINLLGGSNIKIKSCKKNAANLQLEIQQGDKTRIVYIDPKHINLNKYTINKLSHKPPQDFSTKLGNDTHEYYHGGQPYTSDRKGNFSSKYVPFFSSLIDELRVNYKEMVECLSTGNKYLALEYLCKAGSLGADTALSTFKELREDVSKKSGKIKKEINEDFAKKFKNEGMIFQDLADRQIKSDKSLTFDEFLIDKVKSQLKVGESITLTSQKQFNAFFGLSTAGYPFSPGFFSGIVGSLSSQWQMKILKTDNDQIQFSCSRNTSKSVDLIAGTGQGAEFSLVNNYGIDFLTLLPFEANIIISMSSKTENKFSLEMTPENFSEFVGQFNSDSAMRANAEIFNELAEVIENKDGSCSIILSFNAEFRPELGGSLGSGLFIVLPRTSQSVKVNITPMRRDVNETSRGDKGEAELKLAKTSSNTSFLQSELKVSGEMIVMAIPITELNPTVSICNPVPLLNESTDLFSRKFNGFIQSQTKENSITPAVSDMGTLWTCSNIDNISNISIYQIMNNSKKIKKESSIRNLAKQNKSMQTVYGHVKELRETLNNKQRDNLQKTCVISVCAAYQRLSGSSETSNEDRYRLKKLDFYRDGGVQRKAQTPPMPIFNIGKEDSLNYAQNLGKVIFVYSGNGGKKDLPVDAIAQFNFIYGGATSSTSDADIKE